MQKKKWLQKSSSFLNIIIMKDMDDDDESGSDKSDNDSESEEEEEEDGEDGGSGGVAVFDPKASHSSWTFNKKTKYMTCSSGSWNACISKKPCDKFTVELGTGVGSHMIGFIAKGSFQQNNTCNYNNGYFWYTSSSSLYGIGNKLSFSVYGGATSGMKFGNIFDKKKKGIVSFLLNEKRVGDAFSGIDKKAKLFACIDSCTNGANFKFIKAKYPKK